MRDTNKIPSKSLAHMGAIRSWRTKQSKIASRKFRNHARVLRLV